MNMETPNDVPCSIFDTLGVGIHKSVNRDERKINRRRTGKVKIKVKKIKKQMTMQALDKQSIWKLQ